MNQNLCFLYFTKFDIIWISEIKTDFNIHLPGFHNYRNTSNRYSNHGESFCLIKNELETCIKDVEFERDDGIWLSLAIHPDVLFGAFYVPPTDSKYHNFSFAAIVAKVQLDPRKIIIMGD